MRRLAALSVFWWALPASAVTVNWATVGNPGNACEIQTDGCFGAVAYEFRISKHEVTNTEYAEFLNAVADTDPNGLYNTDMGLGVDPQITRSGSPGSFTYSAGAGNEDQPITSFSFYDALRFANWLHNGQPTGVQDATTTEDGAYTFSGPTTVGARNVDAAVALANENEWYKAAYYNSATASYFDYPASSNTLPTCSSPTATPNSANCSGASSYADVGSYTGSPSPYGTFDQGGNVWEWNETVVLSSDRGVRGGTCCHPTVNGPTLLAASLRVSNVPTAEDNLIGFRVVPEPGARICLASGVAALLCLARTRRA